MTRSRTAVLLLVIALAVGAWLRIELVAVKGPMEHDESISYLAASGHQAEYHEYIDLGAMLVEPQWREAGFWQAFLQPEDPLVFGRIARGMAEHDIHPPLYFWLLHLWILAFGVSAQAGPLLNVVLAAATTVSVFFLSRALFRDERLAAFSALLYAILPGAVAMVFLARQYELLALITVLFFWLVASVWSDGRVGWARAVAAVVLGAAGLLTHYHFVFVAIFGFGLLAYRLRGQLRALAALAGAAVVALLATFLGHPGYLEPILGMRERMPDFTWSEFLFRALRVLHTFTEGVGLVAPLRSAIAEGLVPYYGAAGGVLRWATVVLEVLVFVIVGGGVFAVGRAVWRRVRPESREPERGQPSQGAFPLRAAALWVFGVTVALYLAFKSPRHAMGAQYLAGFWPLFAIIAVNSVREARRQVQWTAALVGVLLVPMSLVAISGYAVDNDPAPYLERADALVFSNPARGVWLPFVYEAPPEMQVFVDDADHLVQHPELWLDRVSGGGMLVNHVSYNTTAEESDALGEIFGSTADEDVVEVRLWERYPAWMPQSIANEASAE